MRLKGSPEDVADELLNWAIKKRRETVTVEVDEESTFYLVLGFIAAIIIVVIIVFTSIS